jgi:hypothetical protein
MAKAKMNCSECGGRCEYSQSAMVWYCPDCTEAQAKQKADAEKPTVIIYVEGGLVQDVFKTDKNVRVLVRDYDIEGFESEETSKDEQGREYRSCAW